MSVPGRVVVVGAGAVGGSLAAALALADVEVEVVARGPHLAALRSDGLRWRTPAGEHVVRVPAHADVRDATVDDTTLVAVATKVHQAPPVLDAVLAHAGPDTTVACLHNGVEGERQALRRFRRVLGVLVWVPAVHLHPGVVDVHAAGPWGVLDVGAVPAAGAHPTPLAVGVAALLRSAGADSAAHADVGPLKHAKLLRNLGNVLQAVCGGDDGLSGVPDGPVATMLAAEGEAVLAAAGLAVDDELLLHRAGAVSLAPVAGEARAGGSTWQSVARGTGDVETLALNGEVSLLGRTHGVPTPANDLVCRLALQVAAGSRTPGELEEDDVAAMLAG